MKWAVLLLVLLSASCAKKAEKEAEAVAPVQTAEVRTDSIRRVFEADGILYPRNQASVVPKISAPVRIVEILKLSIPIHMSAHLLCFTVRLQAVSHFMQAIGNHMRKS